MIFGRHVSTCWRVIVFAGGAGRGGCWPRSMRGSQIVRGAVMFGTTASFFLSLSLLPLAEVSTLSSTSPLIIVALASPILGERVSKAAIAGVLIGFAGVVSLIGIDPSHVDVRHLVPLGSATCYAVFSLLTRVLKADPPEVTVFYSGLVSMVAATVLFLIVPRDPLPDLLQWAGIGIVGLTSLTGHRLLVGAYRWGRASDLAPLGYLSLVWSFLSGAIIFGEGVQPAAVLGAIAITIGGLITLRSGAAGDGDVPVSVEYGDAADLGHEAVPGARGGPGGRGRGRGQGGGGGRGLHGGRGQGGGRPRTRRWPRPPRGPRPPRRVAPARLPLRSPAPRGPELLRARP